MEKEKTVGYKPAVFIIYMGNIVCRFHNVMQCHQDGIMAMLCYAINMELRLCHVMSSRGNYGYVTQCHQEGIMAMSCYVILRELATEGSQKGSLTYFNIVTELKNSLQSFK